MAKVDVYELVTNQILERLEKGEIPWKKPWDAVTEWPKNFITGKQYRGINVFLLLMAGYSSPHWATFKQIQERKGKVKKGEKGFPVVFWKTYEKENKQTGENETQFVAKYYKVFNLEQTEGIDYEIPMPEKILNFVKLSDCEEIITKMPMRPLIEMEGNKAYYNPKIDTIRMPFPKVFKSTEAYYATLFHEMGHSTGHEIRLNREGVTNPTQFGSHTYSKEELVAEFCASFLCAEAGIMTNQILDNSAAYIDSWSKVLKKNPKLIVQGAAQAQKAADFILRRQYQNETSEKKEGQFLTPPSLDSSVPCAPALTHVATFDRPYSQEVVS